MPKQFTAQQRISTPKDREPGRLPTSVSAVQAPVSGHDFRSVSIFGPQCKLTVNTPGDAYEQEADAVAAQVMSAPAPDASIQRAGPEDEELQMKPLDAARLQRKENSEDDELQMKPLDFSSVQRDHEAEDDTESAKADGSSAEHGADVSGVVSEGLSGGGRRLDPGTQTFMESRFGHDFSQVKIHTDSRASQSAEAVAARAYTVGGDIAFRSGEYDPASSGGQELLAHELTHVVQQGAASERDNKVTA